MVNPFAMIGLDGKSIGGNKARVKCPECGYVSFADLIRCTRCGRQQQPAEASGEEGSPPPEATAPPASILEKEFDIALNRSEDRRPAAGALADEFLADHPMSAAASSLAQQSLSAAARDAAFDADVAADAGAGDQALFSASDPLADSELTVGPPSAGIDDETSGAISDSHWTDELPSRVANYRRRRASIRGQAEPGLPPQLDLGFSARETVQSSTAPIGAQSRNQAILDRVLNPPAAGTLDISMAASSGETARTGPVEAALGDAAAPAFGQRRTESAAVARAEPPERSARRRKAVRMEPIRLEAELQPDQKAERILVAAPLGPRMMAGLLDAAMLLLYAGIFAAVFLLVGGRPHLRPLPVAVMGLAAAVVAACYFGVFTAFAHSTPGQHAMGLTVRNLDSGDAPNLSRSMLRGLGYVLSAASLMLGFIWAFMDSDELTWQDHISGTFLSFADE